MKISNFHDWLLAKMNESGNGFGWSPVDKFDFGDTKDRPSDYDRSLSDVIKIALQKKPDAVKEFFTKLAEDDDELRELISKLDMEKNGERRPPIKMPGDETVIRSTADGGMGQQGLM